jgi:type IV pilus assembly protein PilV
MKTSSLMFTNRQRGFSLMEVMVALVVLSVGLLGLAALQAEGLRGSSTAQYRFQAVRMMGDILDRMRSNRAGLTSYAVTLAATGTDNGCSESIATPTAANCTAAQMAAHDLLLWKADLITYLGANGDGSIVANGAVARQFTITVQWSERADNLSMSQQVQF